MYSLLNDRVVSNQKLLQLTNRAFRYGDGCFETIRVIDGKPIHLELHYERLVNTLGVLKLNIPNITIQSFQAELEKLIATNEITEGARIRYTVFRDGKGLYTPDSNLAVRLIELSSLESNHYKLNDKGLNCGICKEIVLSYNSFSAYKTLNSLPYVMASIYKEESLFDNLILMNRESRVVEMCNSNIFLIKGSSVFTPPISEGCIDGVYRKYLLHVLPLIGYKVILDPLHINAVSSADEIFVTNSISGIQWVGAMGQKRFQNTKVKEIFSKINSL